MEPKVMSVVARDGFRLAATLYEPDRGSDRTVVIAGATAVKRRYYDRFARFICQGGLRVLTFDYRGIGDSRTGNIREMTSGMREWGSADLAAVLGDVSVRYAGSPLLLVGHSAGGQLLGLADNNRCVEAMLAVAAQSGYWGHWPRPKRYLLAALWYVAMPGLTRLMSYFPAKALRLGEDLPPAVAREWASWCRNPGYFSDPQTEPLSLHLAEFDGDILALGFDDDGMAPRPAVEALLHLYGRARVELRHVVAAEVGAGTIGHFGFFTQRFEDTLWRDALAWLSSARGAGPQRLAHRRAREEAYERISGRPRSAPEVAREARRPDLQPDDRPGR